jgi:hypothetical protein
MRDVEVAVEVVVVHLTGDVYRAVGLGPILDQDTPETETCTGHTREVQCLREDDMLGIEIILALDDA